MPALAALRPRDDDRRNCGRLRTEQLRTDLGRVVNLSATGMRLLARQSYANRIGQSIEVTLKAIDQEATVQATVVWVRRAGFRKHLVGLRFDSLGERDQAWLTDLARTAVFLPGLGNQNVTPIPA